MTKCILTHWLRSEVLWVQKKILPLLNRGARLLPKLSICRYLISCAAFLLWAIFSKLLKWMLWMMLALQLVPSGFSSLSERLHPNDWNIKPFRTQFQDELIFENKKQETPPYRSTAYSRLSSSSCSCCSLGSQVDKGATCSFNLLACSIDFTA